MSLTRNSKIAAAAIAGFVMLMGGPAEAQDRGTTTVFARGSCASLTVLGQSSSCEAVIYAHFKNGRTAWQVPTPEGVLMLSGARDSQPDPTKYILQIDTVRLGSSKYQRAKGTCTANISEDGKYFHALSCSVTSGVKKIELEFKGDGSPVERKDL